MKQRTALIAKIVGSIAIVAHGAAIFLAPASVPPASPLVQASWEKVSPYLHAANLNHGYHFFAPEPGSSTIVQYVGTSANGEQLRGSLPDKRTMKPRLLYHRYFMLTEFLGSIPEDAPIREQVIQNYANQLLKTKNLETVELRIVRHHPSSRQEILIGENLQAPETYEQVSSHRISRRVPRKDRQSSDSFALTTP